MKRLPGKIAVIYSDGTIGAAAAKAFAQEGAEVYLTGRTPSKLEAIAAGIRSSGGSIHTAEVDACDEEAVDRHMKQLIGKTGRIDISFNAIGISQRGIQGTALVDLSTEAFFRPIAVYTQAHFITAKAAAKQMWQQGNGVILANTPNASRISPPFVGGMVPAWAAIEALFRSFSVECGANGLRAVCLLTTGMPDTPLIDEVWDIHGKSHGISFEQFHEVMQSQTHRKRLTGLKEFINALVFVASDEGSAITGSIFNLTAGMVVN